MTMNLSRDFNLDLICPKHLVLIGMMGAGKSAVGRDLQSKTGRTLFDSDRIIEEETKMPIAEIFSTKGEEFFRESEAKTILTLLNREPAIISTGGGAFLNKATRDILISKTKTIYLKASAETLHERTKFSKNRPLLNKSENQLE